MFAERKDGKEDKRNVPSYSMIPIQKNFGFV